jgi:hypothetical protein
MNDTNAATCVNHPERAAIEHCEVCGDPLCAYCLYYTSDGQRLCKTHAAQAEAAGAFVRSPDVYAEGLVPAQVEASRRPAYPTAAPYEGNTPDVTALIGMMIAVVSLLMCIPGFNCLLGPVGLIVSLVALFTSRDARNRSRTRIMAGIGIGLSSLWMLIVIACLATYFVPLVSISTGLSSGTQVFMPVVVTVQYQQPPARQPVLTSTPYPSPTMVPTIPSPTPLPERSSTPAPGR